MTDPLAPLTDEELSAVLDGDASADVTARAEAEPAARARLGQLRTASAAMQAAAVPALAPSVVDDLVGRALAAADEAPRAADAGNEDADAVVAPLRPSGSRGGGVPRWLVAAAVVVLVGLGLVLVWSGRDDTSSSDTAGRATTAQEKAADQADSSGAANDQPAAAAPDATVGDGAAPHGSPTTTTAAANSQASASGLVDLGTFATTTDLRTTLKAGFPASAPAFDRDAGAGAGSDAGAVTNASVDRCDGLAQQIFEITDGPLRRGVATVDGRVLYVYEYPYTSDASPDATRLVIAAGQDSCNVELSFVR